MIKISACLTSTRPGKGGTSGSGTQSWILKHVARVFFWDDAKESTGVMVLAEGARTDVAALHSVIRKRASDPALRTKYLSELKSPLERYYSNGTLPEEAVT
jgi:hypothetical protein